MLGYIRDTQLGPAAASAAAAARHSGLDVVLVPLLHLIRERLDTGSKAALSVPALQSALRKIPESLAVRALMQQSRWLPRSVPFKISLLRYSRWRW